MIFPMKPTVFFLFIFMSSGLFPQSEATSSYDAKEIEKLYIYSDEVFKINLKSAKTDKIIITSNAKGEYYNDISLNVELQKDRMTITSNYNDMLQEGYDKLSAHKVFSLEIELEVPEGLEVYIRSNITSLLGQGSFKYLEAELRSGFCLLTNFSGNALIKTYSGGIEVETSNATITATSRNGLINLPVISDGEQKVELHSITGDIRVRKTK